MNPYSHFVAANYLEPYLDLDNKQDYYLGTIIPDIRYYLKMPRKDTHLKLEDIVAYFNKYPELKSFITGYLVHNIIDGHIKPGAILPLYLRPVFFFLPKYVLQVLVEIYYMENIKVMAQISTTGNKMLDDLSIERRDVTVFTENISTFVNNPSLELGIKVAKDLNILKHPDSNKYNKIATMVNNSKLKNTLFMRFNEQKLRRKMTSFVLSQLKKNAPATLI